MKYREPDPRLENFKNSVHYEALRTSSRYAKKKMIPILWGDKIFPSKSAAYKHIGVCQPRFEMILREGEYEGKRIIKLRKDANGDPILPDRFE